MKKLAGMAVVAIVTVVMGGIGYAGSAAPALKTAPGSTAEAHNNEGISEYNLAYWEDAYKHFQEAVNADPQSAEAHYNLALALDKMGEHMNAAKHFKVAADLGQDNPEIQNSRILKAHLKMLR